MRLAKALRRTVVMFLLSISLAVVPGPRRTIAVFRRFSRARPRDRVPAMCSVDYDPGMSLKRMILWTLLIIVLGIVAWLTGSNSPLK